MPVCPRQTIRLLWPPHKRTINSLPLAHPGDRSPATTNGGQVRIWFITYPVEAKHPFWLVHQQIGILDWRPGITFDWAVNRPPGGQTTQTLPA